jgi:hypothetical protein
MTLLQLEPLPAGLMGKCKSQSAFQSLFRTPILQVPLPQGKEITLTSHTDPAVLQIYQRSLTLDQWFVTRDQRWQPLGTC